MLNAEDPRRLCFWRDQGGLEVDFILGDGVAIEAQATENVHDKLLKPLVVLKDEMKLRHRVVVSLESVPRKVQGIDVLPWKVFLERLWAEGFKE